MASKIPLNTIFNKDCLEGMKGLPDGCIDMVLCDLPYGTTACKWDTCIPFEPLWEQYHRLVKPSGAIVLFGSEPFSTALRHSNLKEFRYDWIWEKEQGANFMLCKYQPYKVHEIISVFSRERHLYHPQMTAGKPYISGKGTSGDVTGNVKKKQTVNTGTRYPRSILRFNTDKGRGGYTQHKNPLPCLSTSSKHTAMRGTLCLITVSAPGPRLWQQSTLAGTT
jgi:site-specific DNA-methyltransferase (adenine-specific)